MSFRGAISRTAPGCQTMPQCRFNRSTGGGGKGRRGAEQASLGAATSAPGAGSPKGGSMFASQGCAARSRWPCIRKSLAIALHPPPTDHFEQSLPALGSYHSSASLRLRTCMTVLSSNPNVESTPPSPPEPIRSSTYRHAVMSVILMN